MNTRATKQIASLLWIVAMLVVGTGLTSTMTGCKSTSSSDGITEHDDPNVGRTQVRNGEHRHFMDGQWTPWHPIKGDHKFGAAPAPAPAGDGLIWTRLAYPTGDPNTSALLIEKGFPREVNLGQEFEYIIRVTNLTSVQLNDVVVNDQTPDGFEFVSSDPPPAATGASILRDDIDGTQFVSLDTQPVLQAAGAKTLTYRYAKLAGKEVQTIKVKGKATKLGDIVTCAKASYNQELCNQTKVVQPQLALAKTLPAEVLQCDPILMNVKVTNNGTGTATGVKISDALPEGLMTADGKQTWTQDVGTLAPGESRDFAVELKASKKGKLDNTATASGDGNLQAEASASVLVKKPELELATDCSMKSYLGRDVCVDITVTNKGDGVAKNTVAVAELPAGTTFVSASAGGVVEGNKVTWNLGVLDPNGSRKLRVCYKPVREGAYKLSAAAQAYCADGVAGTCETTVEGIPAILLEVIDVEDPVEVGKSTTYIITATNQGSAVGKNVKIVATLEDEAEFVNADGSATKGNHANRVITFEPLPSLAVGGKATWKVTVKAIDAGDTRFKVEMTEDQLTRPVSETEATNFFK